MDLKELTQGTTLYLPVFVPGGNFSCGDGHGVQGDGEVCVTALETALSGTFRLTVRKDLQFKLPRAETPTHPSRWPSTTTSTTRPRMAQGND